MVKNFAPSILIVASEEPMLTVLSYNLERYGYIVNSAKDSNNAIITAERIQPSMIIIDEEMQNGLSGIELCAILKTKSDKKNIPIILMTKDANKYTKIKELTNSINDFITKPFAPSELVSKIKSYFKRIVPTNQHIKVLEYSNIKMNIGSYQVTKNGKRIHLGPTEFRILQCLMELPGRILSREHIMTQVWGHNSQVEPRTIDVHINRLRSALKNDNKEDTMIKTIRSAGYCLTGTE